MCLKQKRENVHTNKCGNAREHEYHVKAAGKKLNEIYIYIERERGGEGGRNVCGTQNV